MHVPLEEMPIELQADGIEIRSADWGEQLLRYLDLPAGVDLRPLLKGLPGDQCSCPHWGMVIEGSITVRYEDGTEETTKAGEAYYWRGGHTGWTDEGVVFFEISPTAEITPVLEHLAAQMAAAG